MFLFRSPTRVVLKAKTPSKLEEIIDRLSPKMQRAIRQAATTAQGRIDLEALSADLEAGRVGRAVRQLGVDTFTSEDLREASQLIADAHLAGRAIASPVTLALDVTNPKALAAAERQAADLLTAVNVETKQTVRNLIARAYREQITSRDTARLIRDVVGLNDRQATALFNYRAGLIKDEVEPARIERLTARYGDRLLRDRAKTIAQTEIHRASAEGQHELWREGVRDGRINAATARRIWIANVGACFVAESLVMTRTGDKPIASLVIGDYVKGPSGKWLRVLNTRAISYAGPLVDGPQFSCTPDHRILSDALTWLPAGEYLRNASGYVGKDARAEESDNDPPALTEIRRLPFVFSYNFWMRRTVPVIAVCKDDDVPLGDSEVGSPMSLSVKDFEGLVYDITVEKEHAFVLACGVVAHNCDWCEAIESINADGVPIDGQFETPDGDMISGPEESHVGCRCSTGLDMEE